MNTKTTIEDMKPILFYRVAEPYDEFSNFASFPISMRGRTWPTTEHYFQAQKFAGNGHEETIRLAKSPMIAARLGRSRAHPLRPDWEQVKEGIMREALEAKFTQHPKLKTLLLSTGEAQLVEHTRNDCYWGDGGDGSGKNRLGHLLMELRADFRNNLKGQ
jgi:N-glycosidase YbiA